MTYPGDTSLSDEIRERILTTFEQALDLAGSGSRREALLGCDFVLRLDPLFEPARILHKRLSEGGDQIEVADLRGTGSEAPTASGPVPTRPSRTGAPGDSSAGAADTVAASRDTFDPAATVAQRAPDAPATGASADEKPQPALGDIELDSGGAAESRDAGADAGSLDPGFGETADLATGSFETGTFETGTFETGKFETGKFAIDPLADTIFAEEPPTGEATAGAHSPEETTPAPPLSIEELEVEEPEAIDLDTVLAETATEPPAPPSAAEQQELVTTFLNTPLDGEPPTGGDLMGDLDPVSDMAEPLGAPAQLDEESQRRIEELLEEGQNAFDIGEYQSAIDSWSRVFLIDIDHSEANHRIEQARRMAAEAERRVEEVFHEAISHLDAGDSEAARESLTRVLELQPGHLAAQELLDKIDSGEAFPEPPRVEDSGPTTPAGFDLEDTYEPEEADEDSEDLFAPPDVVPAAAELTATPPPPTPARAKRPRQTFLIVGSLVLLLVIAGGWYLMSRWESLFPNADIAQGVPAPQRIDPIARAKKLHEQGKTAIAIAQLRRLPPGDPHYAEAQALVAQWETAETETDLDAPAEEEMERYAELIARARQAHAQSENLLAENLLSRAAAIAPLDESSQALQAEAAEALEPLAEQIQVFRAGDWEYALPTLWRMREEDVANADINRLIIDSYYNLGVRDLQRGRPDLALRKFEEALTLRPDDPTLKRLQAFASTYEDRGEDLLYRIFVKYLPFR